MLSGRRVALALSAAKLASAGVAKVPAYIAAALASANRPAEDKA